MRDMMSLTAGLLTSLALRPRCRFLPTSHPSFHSKIIGDFHYFFAAASMISLALMALQFIKDSAR
jgi:hypothetical protein